MSYSWDRREEDYRNFLRRRAPLESRFTDVHVRAAEICLAIPPDTCELLGPLNELCDALGDEVDAVRAEALSNPGVAMGLPQRGTALTLPPLDSFERGLHGLVEIAQPDVDRPGLTSFCRAVQALNGGRFDDALRHVTEAITESAQGGGHAFDWRFHWLNGHLRLGRPEMHHWSGIDPGAAEEAFLLSAERVRHQSTHDAAMSLLMASVAAHAQSREVPAKLYDMRRHAEAAWLLDHDLGVAAFQFAKAQMALDEPDSSCSALRHAIQCNRLFSIRAAEDPDFRRHTAALHRLFKALKSDKVAQLAEQAKVTYQQFEPLISKRTELAFLESSGRLRAVAHGAAVDWGLVRLLEYEATGLHLDIESTSLEIARQRTSFTVGMRFTAKHWEECIVVEEQYEEEVTTFSDVVVKPGNWLRKPVIQSRAETRVITGTRTVQKSVARRLDLPKVVVVDGFGEVFTPLRVGDMVRIPAGKLTVRTATFTNDHPFLIAVEPVNQADYTAVMGTNPSRNHRADFPVTGMSWTDALLFCNASSRAHGLEEAYAMDGNAMLWKGLDCEGYRLPTVAEWEFACLAGSRRDFDYVDASGRQKREFRGMTSIGRELKPGAWGLVHAEGIHRFLTEEWCWGASIDSARSVPIKSTELARGSGFVFRDGTWWDSSQPQLRDRMFSMHWGGDLTGIRLVRSTV